MKLTAETFEQLVCSLKAQSVGEHATRKSARAGLHGAAQMIAIEEPGVPPERHAVNVRDVSVEGINVLHHSPMRQGRKFVIELERVLGPALKLLCIVRHCRMVATSPALYSIGAIFRRDVTSTTAKKPTVAA